MQWDALGVDLGGGAGGGKCRRVEATVAVVGDALAVIPWGLGRPQHGRHGPAVGARAGALAALPSARGQRTCRRPQKGSGLVRAAAFFLNGTTPVVGGCPCFAPAPPVTQASRQARRHSSLQLERSPAHVRDVARQAWRLVQPHREGDGAGEHVHADEGVRPARLRRRGASDQRTPRDARCAASRGTLGAKPREFIGVHDDEAEQHAEDDDDQATPREEWRGRSRRRIFDDTRTK